LRIRKRKLAKSSNLSSGHFVFASMGDLASSMGSADAELVAFRVVHDHEVDRVFRIVLSLAVLHAGS
jgi:hypothetical protein